jgi:hypothetical protein
MIITALSLIYLLEFLSSVKISPESEKLFFREAKQ